MDNCHRKGKLYAFFLEIASEVVIDIVHQRLNVPKNGRLMYIHLRDHFQNEDKYQQEILGGDFPNYQKRQLLPKDHIIKVEKLDFTMYMKILWLLEKRRKTGLYKDICDYMNKTRNGLCHASFFDIRQSMSQQDFIEELDMMAFHFKHYGADKALVDFCKTDVLNRQ